MADESGADDQGSNSEGIDLDLLDALGVSPEKAQAHIDQLRKKREEQEAEARARSAHTEAYYAVAKAEVAEEERQKYLEMGDALYKEMLENPRRGQFAVGLVAGTNLVVRDSIRHLVPQSLIDANEKFKREFPKSRDLYEPWDKVLPVIIEGFGRAAIAHMSPDDPSRNDPHWKSVVTAFDLITEGGVRKNDEAMSTLRKISEGNVTLKVEIHNFIQKNEKEKTKATP
jgi:hypothetical protein